MAETESNFRRFSDNEELLAENLSNDDIFPLTQKSTNEDRKIKYGELKDKLTEDIFQNSEVLESLSDETIKSFSEKIYGSVKPSFQSSIEENIDKRLTKYKNLLTGGAAVELTDELGNVDNMFKIPKFNCEDICLSGELGTGTFPAFIGKDGEEYDFIYVGQYQAANNGSGIPVSQYNKSPWVNIDFDTARAKCLQKGNGYHLITNFEWAAIAYWTLFAKGIEPAGNVSSSAAIGTGTGGATYAHNRKNNGIFDLVGNVWEWTDGIKQDENNHILLCETNDISKMTNSEDESTWLDCGERPNFSSGSVMWRDAYKNIGNDKDEEVRLLFKRGLVRPIGEHQFNGNGWSSAGERVLLRGGGWNAGASAGLGAFTLDTARSITYSTVGFRFAFLP